MAERCPECGMMRDEPCERDNCPMMDEAEAQDSAAEERAEAAEGTTHDDLEFDPSIEPRSSKAWLNLLEESEKAFEDWNDHCDKIDKQYANLQRLATMGRDREFQMFWANIEVLKPNLYAKPPEPVVVPKFKDRRPVPQAASEMLERCCTVAFDLTRIDDLMKQVRDDVAITNRGVAWCRYESKDERGGYYATERVCIEHKDRKDFLHSLSRAWPEVTWVAAASYLTRNEARERFKEHSGDAYLDAEYAVDKDANEVGGADNRERAKFWEIWHKTERRVVWVAKGCEDILDEDDPEIEYQNFWPCPQPAYGTIQRGSLVPVPDVLQYKDQLEELNMLTGRIHALSDALEAKGFYPAGGAELADAIQTAIAIKTPGRVLVPINNWAAFGGSKEIIIWMPIEEIAGVMTTLVQLRTKIIEDIYQIMGLSDIMRGATDARETLGAQQLKSQYGASRIRDRQQELVRFARDLVEITADIITEKFNPVTMIMMSQTQLPTQAMQREQVQQIQQQAQRQMLMVQKLQQMPQVQQMAQQNPQGAQQVQQQLQQAQQQAQQTIENILKKPTVEQVFTFLQDNRARAFVLDIETDSTILVDEQAEKQRRNEFVGVLGQLLPQLTQLIMVDADLAPLAGEILKFATAPYRVGRSLDGAIDDAVAHIQDKAGQPKGDDPTTMQNKTALQIEQMKDQRERDKDKNDNALRVAELKQRDDHAKEKLASEERMQLLKMRAGQQQDATDQEAANLKAMQEREKHQAAMQKTAGDMAANRQKMDMAREQQALKQQDMQQRQDERRAAQAFRQQQALERQNTLVPQ